MGNACVSERTFSVAAERNRTEKSVDLHAVTGPPVDPFQRSREIDRQIAADKRNRILKVLLLGPGDSGKSTTLKQLRIIHDRGFSEEERIAKRYVIYLNLITGMVDVINAIEERKLNFKNADSWNLARDVSAYYEAQRTHESADLSGHVANSIARLLSDETVINCLKVSTQISIDESSKYFLANLGRIRAKDYLPTDEDLLKMRVSTSGVIQFSFLIKSYTFKVFDVGGQKAQRRKWIHVFDDVHAVLFITSLSEYNQMLAEDSQKNRMRDSIELFESICNNEWFRETAIILFLNKIDLFAEKIRHFPITLALPRYKGEQAYRPSLDYIARKYRHQNKNVKRQIYLHETCATDTSQIEIVINSVTDVIIQQTLQRVGIQ